QVVQLEWTNAARGGEGACSRSAIPSAFEVPSTDLLNPEGQLCVDVLRWGERNGFVEPFSTHRQHVLIDNGFRFGCVSMMEQADGVQVRYRYEPNVGGAPDRRTFTPEGHRESRTRTLPVRDGEWVQVCYNGRFSCIDTGNWWYQ